MATETYEIVISGTLAGQFVQSVFHANTDESIAGNPFENAEAIFNAMNVPGQFFEEWCNSLPVQYSITSVRIRRILNTGGPTFIALKSALYQSDGQRTGNISSAQVNPVLVWITTPRPNKPGRTFLPGVSESDIDAMAYASGLVTQLNTLIGVVTTVNTEGPQPIQMVIYRRALSNADDITYGRISPLVGTQRRRLKPV